MKNKIRVLHILDELNTGGAEKIVVSYFMHIDREKFQWDFIITKYADKNKSGILEEKVNMMGGQIYRVPRKRENYLANIKAIDKIIKNGNYDIVHSHLDELSTFYLFSAKRYHVPVRICHSHLAGTDRGWSVEMLCKVLKPFLRLVVTDKFACGIEAARTLWGETSIEKNTVYIMHNAIETTDFTFDENIRQQIRTKLELGNKMVLGSVGRLSYQKNSEFIIEIFSEYKKIDENSVLLVIGQGDKEEEMRKIVKRYGIQDSVKFLGGREDVHHLMMAMDAFILPSRFEGLPIVMVEAQCAGLRCYVSDSITKEIRINPNVYYYPLACGSQKWAENISLDTTIFDRSQGNKSIEMAGYKIGTEAKRLQEYYMKAGSNLC
jgi:glycosyltransferase involved in cell wall biosynthesis